MVVQFGIETGAHLLEVIDSIEYRRQELSSHPNHKGGIEQYLKEKLEAGKNPLLADLWNTVSGPTTYSFERPIREHYALLKLDRYFETLSKEQRLHLANKLGETECNRANELDIVREAGMLMEDSAYPNEREKDYNMYCVLHWRAMYEVYKQVMEPMEQTLRSRSVSSQEDPRTLIESEEIKRMFPEGFEYVRDWLKRNLQSPLPLVKVEKSAS